MPLKSLPQMLAVAVLTLFASITSAEQKPNIVLLLADDMGSADLGCYGGPVKTPTIDKLAAAGTRFEQFYAACAVCSPTRASLLTGRHHIRSGVWSWIAEPDPTPKTQTRKNNKSHLLESEVTLAEHLKSYGYATMHTGKWHLGLLHPDHTKGITKPTPADHGFDHWLGTSLNAHPSHHNVSNFFRNGKPIGKQQGYSCQMVVDEAINWLEGRTDKEQPFFLNVWFHEPHAPIAAPEEYVTQYGKVKERPAIYSGTIHNLDTAVARLVKYLGKIGVKNETLIVFMSDNGSYMKGRNGTLRGMKGTNWEGGVRVPGIFYWPGTIPSRVVSDEHGSVLDIFPTVCEFIGIPLPDDVHYDGASLAGYLLQEEKSVERSQSLFWHLQKSRPIVALRNHNYALVADPDFELSTNNLFNEDDIPKIKNGGYTNYRLYDLKQDPSQTTDLASEKPGVVQKLKDELLEINASIMADGHDWHLE